MLRQISSYPDPLNTLKMAAKFGDSQLFDLVHKRVKEGAAIVYGNLIKLAERAENWEIVHFLTHA